MKSGEFRLYRGPIFTQILLGDEINRAAEIEIEGLNPDIAINRILNRIEVPR